MANEWQTNGRRMVNDIQSFCNQKMPDDTKTPVKLYWHKNDIQKAIM